MLVDNLTLGYYRWMINIISAASIMGNRSVEVRVAKWGRREFVRKLRRWGKLGGRPKGSVGNKRS